MSLNVYNALNNDKSSKRRRVNSFHIKLSRESSNNRLWNQRRFKKKQPQKNNVLSFFVYSLILSIKLCICAIQWLVWWLRCWIRRMSDWRSIRLRHFPRSYLAWWILGVADRENFRDWILPPMICRPAIWDFYIGRNSLRNSRSSFNATMLFLVKRYACSIATKTNS